MKTYRSLKKSLPAKTVVFAFGRFNPPHKGHQLMIRYVQKVAQQNNADCIIFISKSQDPKKNPLSVERKLHYLTLMFPGVKFDVPPPEEKQALFGVFKKLSKKYKNAIMVAGSDRIPEYERIANNYNGKDFTFDSVKIESAGERDPDADGVAGAEASKMRAYATKGDFTKFKNDLPSTMRAIDARRMMNDVRQGMGLDAIKEQLNISTDNLREQYVKGDIYKVGDLVEAVNGAQLEIIKRGTNYLLVKDAEGQVSSRWLHEVVQGAAHA